MSRRNKFNFDWWAVGSCCLAIYIKNISYFMEYDDFYNRSLHLLLLRIGFFFNLKKRVPQKKYIHVHMFITGIFFSILYKLFSNECVIVVRHIYIDSSKSLLHIVISNATSLLRLCFLLKITFNLLSNLVFTKGE